jgi:hypothetical protein
MREDETAKHRLLNEMAEVESGNESEGGQRDAGRKGNGSH